MSFQGSEKIVRLTGADSTPDVSFADGVQFIVLESVTLNGVQYKGDGELEIVHKASGNKRRLTSGDQWPFTPSGEYRVELDGDTLQTGDTMIARFITYQSATNVPFLQGTAGNQGRAQFPVHEFTGKDLASATHSVTLDVARTQGVTAAAEDGGGGTLDVKLEWLDPNDNVLFSETPLTNVSSDFVHAVTKGRRVKISFINNTGANDVSGTIVTHA